MGETRSRMSKVSNKIRNWNVVFIHLEKTQIIQLSLPLLHSSTLYIVVLIKYLIPVKPEFLLPKYFIDKNYLIFVLGQLFRIAPLKIELNKF